MLAEYFVKKNAHFHSGAECKTHRLLQLSDRSHTCRPPSRSRRDKGQIRRRKERLTGDTANGFFDFDCFIGRIIRYDDGKVQEWRDTTPRFVSTFGRARRNGTIPEHGQDFTIYDSTAKVIAPRSTLHLRRTPVQVRSLVSFCVLCV